MRLQNVKKTFDIKMIFFLGVVVCSKKINLNLSTPTKQCINKTLTSMIHYSSYDGMIPLQFLMNIFETIAENTMSNQIFQFYDFFFVACTYVNMPLKIVEFNAPFFEV